MTSEDADVVGSGSKLVPGAVFPDHELTGHDRKRHRLSEIQGSDPMILILSRGHFCPKDARQHKIMADFYPQIAVAYTKIVTISTDNVLEANEMRDSAGAPWLFLTDPQRSLQKELGIQEYTDPHHDPMIPHTLVLESGLVIYKAYNGYWFWGRPSPWELWQDLREVSRRIRPDWDITQPELRANFEQGDKSRHWPYGRR
ncbi:MAG: redoxin domain-containing protein [Chloroflexi bacterium]|nr:redoxin domain-containing protein [Chloroflexota bacterium]